PPAPAPAAPWPSAPGPSSPRRRSRIGTTRRTFQISNKNGRTLSRRRPISPALCCRRSCPQVVSFSSRQILRHRPTDGFVRAETGFHEIFRFGKEDENEHSLSQMAGNDLLR